MQFRFSIIVFLLLSQSVFVCAQDNTIKIDAGFYDRVGVPVQSPIPDSVPKGHPFILISTDTNARVPTQSDYSGDVPVVRWMLEQPLYSGQSRSYRFVLVDGFPKRIPRVRATNTNDAIKITVGELPVLEYNMAIRPSPDETKPHYARSGFIHPIFDPLGNVLTDDFPPDHMHQHGVMFPYTKTTFRDQAVDFWNQAAKQGNVTHANLVGTFTGPVFGGFVAELHHVAFLGTDKSTTALTEIWKVVVYQQDELFLIDFTSTQKCATDDPLVLQEYHYGGWAIRGRRNWVKATAGAGFLTSEGKKRDAGNHTRPKWVNIHGPVSNGKQAGITVLNHPDNYRFPQPVRLHPSMPYFCWAPMVLGDYKIEPGKPLVTKYRMVVHQGKVNAAKMTELYNDFTHPAVGSTEK